MELRTENFNLFQRDYFSFKKLKETLTEEELHQLKNAFQENWQQFKTLQLQVGENLPESFQLGKPKIESWTNGWNLRNHFWSCYRQQDKKEWSPCLATLLNQKNYQVYLMFQHYQKEKRQGSVEKYNLLLEKIPSWSEHLTMSEYYLWTNFSGEFPKYLSLKDYLEDKDQRENFNALLEKKKGTFCLGKVKTKEQAPFESLQWTVQALEELFLLYDQALK